MAERWSKAKAKRLALQYVLNAVAEAEAGEQEYTLPAMEYLVDSRSRQILAEVEEIKEELAARLEKMGGEYRPVTMPEEE